MQMRLQYATTRTEQVLKAITAENDIVKLYRNKTEIILSKRRCKAVACGQTQRRKQHSLSSLCI